MNRRQFVGSLTGIAVLSTASLEAALIGGKKTLVIGASKAGCEYAMAQSEETILLDHGILPAIELGHDQSDVWSEKLLKANCRVLLAADLESVVKLPDGMYRVTAYGQDGRHVFEVAEVKDLSTDGWHRGEWR